MREMLRELEVLVSQLEPLLADGRLSLQKMLFMLQPARLTVRSLDTLATRLRNQTGGKLLDALFSITYEQGDDRGRQLFLHLLHRSSRPFMRMVLRWLLRGELEDPYGELMIQEDASLMREALQQDFNAQVCTCVHCS